ncbi:hypothetical protein [Sphingopyxis sp.]|uniref:hypothetical protein n=1 Tax=Sphingopyxis sp. TaxID=1908224 RepID=UPI0035B06CE8
MKHRTHLFTAIAATVALTAVSTADARQGSVRARGQNGVVAGSTGPNGTVVRGRSTVQNPDGSTTRRSGGAFVGANGRKGKAGASTTVAPDGTADRATQGSIDGPRGSASSSSNFQRGADGTWTGGRSSTVTNSGTGKTYSGTTTIDPATGKPVHSGTCTDAAGTVVDCR